MAIKKLNLRILITLFLFVVLFFYLTPTQVYSAGLVPCGGEGESACQLCHFFVMFDNIAKFVLTRLVPPIGVLMLVIGGVMFFMAAGNPAGISKAKSLLTSVIIGLIIIYGAYLLISAFFTIIGVNEWTGLKTWFKYPCP